MRYIGIVGSSGEKLTKLGELRAKEYITQLLTTLQKKYSKITVVSGRCPFGGIDVIAEDFATRLNIPTKPFKPTKFNWNAPGGFKERNIKIAQHSDEVHVFVVNQLPYDNKENNYCYHCDEKGHVPSGGCWTGHHARKLGKYAEWHIVENKSELEEVV